MFKQTKTLCTFVARKRRLMQSGRALLHLCPWLTSRMRTWSAEDWKKTIGFVRSTKPYLDCFLPQFEFAELAFNAQKAW